MRKAVYPGTFDPVTNGHLDLIQRGLKIFDQVVVAVALNPKKEPLFSTAERLQMLREAVQGLQGVKVEAFHGLLVDYVLSQGAVAIIRGLRAVSDFEYELQMALMNRRLSAQVETVFMMPPEEYSFLSSSIIKEVASFGGSLRGLVPPHVEQALRRKSSLRKEEPEP